MTKVRLLSRCGDGLPLLHRMMVEGTEADFFVEQPRCRRAFVGMIDQIPDAPGDLSDVDLVLFDSAGRGALADQTAAQGETVYGASRLGDCLQGDTAFLLKIAKADGILVPDFAECESWDQVQEFADHSLCVFRPAKVPAPRWCFVPRDLAEQEIFLDQIARMETVPKMVVERAVGGIDVTIGCFYFQGKAIESTMHSAVELTRFMAGGVGPQTGGVGCVAWFWRNRNNKLWRLTHLRLASFLARNHYTGVLSLRVCVPEDNDHLPYLVEASTQFDYPVIQALCGGVGVTVTSFLVALADGTAELKPSSDWLGALEVSVPPYPNPVDATGTAGYPICGVDPDDSQFWPMDVRTSEDGYVTAGVNGQICDLTATAGTLAELEERLLAKAQDLTLLDKQYRVDAVSTIAERLRRLEAWKYINLSE